MAKYRLKPSLIATLTAKGYIDGSSMMTIRIPYRASGEVQTRHELTFNVNEALETDNPVAMRAIANTAAPRIKSNGAWLIMDPTILWFEELPPEDSTTAKVPHTHGTEILTRGQKKMLHHYRRKTGMSIPATLDKTATAASLANAKSFFANS